MEKLFCIFLLAGCRQTRPARIVPNSISPTFAIRKRCTYYGEYRMSDCIKMWRWVGCEPLIGGGERKIHRTPVLPERKVRGPVMPPSSPAEKDLLKQGKNIDLKNRDNNYTTDCKMWRWVGCDPLIGGGERKIHRTPVLPGRKLRGPVMPPSSPTEKDLLKQGKNIDLKNRDNNNNTSDCKMWRWVGCEPLIGGGERKIHRTPVLPGRKLRGPVMPPSSPAENDLLKQGKNIDLNNRDNNMFDYKMWRWVSCESLSNDDESEIHQTPVLSGGTLSSSSSSSSSSSELTSWLSSSTAPSLIIPPSDFDVHEYLGDLLSTMKDDANVQWFFNEITGALHTVDDLSQWFAESLINEHVIKMDRSRASLFRRLLDYINIDVVYDLVLTETRKTIRDLSNDLPTSLEPKLIKWWLKNLRNWLSLITFGMNRPMPKTDPNWSTVDAYKKDGEIYYYS